MSDSFGKQLQLDGAYSAVTFICTKTDDINQTEMSKVIPQEDHIFQLHQDLETAEDEARKLKAEMARVESELNDFDYEADRLDKTLSCITNALRSAKQDENEVLLVSPVSSRKRKPLSTTQPAARKKPARRHEEDDVFVDADSNSDDSDVSEEEYVRTPTDEEAMKLSKEEAEQHRDGLISEKGLLGEKIRAKKKEKKHLRHQNKSANKKIKILKSQIKSACIKYRNEHSRPDIQRQFANGIQV
jgi:hypothetical protein